MKIEDALGQAFDHFINDTDERWPVMDIRIVGHSVDDADRILTITTVELEFCELADGSYNFESGLRKTHEYGTDTPKAVPISFSTEEIDIS